MNLGQLGLKARMLTTVQWSPEMRKAYNLVGLLSLFLEVSMGGAEQNNGSVPLKNPVPFCSVPLVGSADSVLPMLTWRI